MRWEPCVQHFDEEVGRFIHSYFSSSKRRVVLIGAAGFDPLSTSVPRLFSSASSGIAAAMFIREERPGAAAVLRKGGDRSASTLGSMFTNAKFPSIDIFDPSDQAVVGGREAVAKVAGIDWTGVTDVVVDMSVLTVGISFPIVKWLLDTAPTMGVNVHAIVAHRGSGATGDREFADTATWIHGFDGSLGLYAEQQSSAWLWIPQLAPGKVAAFESVFRFLQSRAGDDLYEVCPLLPFPSPDPRIGDEIVLEFQEQLNNEWRVDERSLFYAADDDPGDVYRILLRLDRERRAVFQEAIGGSKLVVSPLGGKATALGCLMAAVEADMPVVYLETLRYASGASAGHSAEPQLVHVWLAGNAYGTSRYS